MTIEQLKQIIQKNGVAGAGGAGFPTYAKIDEKTQTLIVNCAECEPILKLDRQLLEHHAYDILKTLSMIADTLNIQEAIIGIKEEYKGAILSINKYIREFPKIKIHLLDNIYPSGDEVVLIYEIAKKVVKPGGLPIDLGITVMNVETVYNIFKAVELSQPVTDKLITIAGEVSSPKTVRVPLGMTISQTVALAGEITAKESVFFIGGVMMGSIAKESDVVTKMTNAIIVLPKDHFLVRMKQSNTSIDLKRAGSSCCQCRACSDLCPRNALGHPIEPHKFMIAAYNKNFQDLNVFLDTFFCSSCGICELYACPQSLSPRSLIAEYKQGLAEAGVKKRQDAKKTEVKASREYRKIPEERLVSRLGLKKYEFEIPFDETEVEVDYVKILMKQHIGAPSQPIVSVGEIVEKGQVIGTASQGLSIAVHASISGKITQVSDEYIVIDKVRGGVLNE